jgi:hypothetical protein
LALDQAVELDNIVYVEALTQNGGSPFLLDDRGWTAMHYAAYFNHVRCLSLLLKRGCKGKNDLLLDTEGRTTLQVAEQYRALVLARAPASAIWHPHEPFPDATLVRVLCRVVGRVVSLVVSCRWSCRVVGRVVWSCRVVGRVVSSGL